MHLRRYSCETGSAGTKSNNVVVSYFLRFCEYESV